MLKLEQTVAPAAAAIDRDTTVNTHLRIDGAEEGAYLDMLIAAATSHVEAYTGRQLITATYKLSLDCLPTRIYLPRPPLGAISSITYYDAGGTQQTLSSSLYQVDSARLVPLVTPAVGQTYPTTQSGRANAVEVTYTAGYGASHENVPDGIKLAMLLLIGHWYENREEVITGTVSKLIETASSSLLSPYVVPWAWADGGSNQTRSTFEFL